MSKQIPNGLVFSSEDPGRRKKALIISLILIIIQFGFLWPVYPLFASPTPLILGLPLSMVWVLGLLVFAAFIVLVFFLSDNKREH